MTGNKPLALARISLDVNLRVVLSNGHKVFPHEWEQVIAMHSRRYLSEKLIL